MMVWYVRLYLAAIVAVQTNRNGNIIIKYARANGQIGVLTVCIFVKGTYIAGRTEMRDFSALF